MATLKSQEVTKSGVTYGDPAVPGLKVRFKILQSPKVLNGVPVTNNRTELILTDAFGITVDGNNVTDAVSVRLHVSGALESRPRVLELLEALHAQLLTWETEDVFVGFPPQTAPVIPKAV